MNRKNLYKNLQFWAQEAHKKNDYPYIQSLSKIYSSLKVSSVLNWYTINQNVEEWGRINMYERILPSFLIHYSSKLSVQTL